MTDDFRLRQVHLDFHTSPLIENIGAGFDKEEWKNTLTENKVDSITVFAKCHHGCAYYPTKVGTMHPGLSFDLLGAQLEACAEAGVRAPVYISAGVDEIEAVKHPEWVLRNKDDYMNPVDYSRPGYHVLCLNTPYLEKLLAETKEVMHLYNPCEIFLDILGERDCYCEKCRNDMKDAGLDCNNPDDVKAFAKKVYRNYLDRMSEAIREYSGETAIFHNSGHLKRGRRDLVDSEVHFELESLPTGGWGYDHFPLSAAYARTLRKNYLGMTGKFHRTWGEFGGFKHPNALRYEVSLCLALGAGCSVGDQMHPEGILNKSTFGLIGKAYREYAEKENFCRNATAVTEIAVLSAECLEGKTDGAPADADVGANRILLETKRLYNIIDTEEDFSKYKLLILPDLWQTDEHLAKKLNDYLAGGGKLLLSGKSGTDENGNFTVDTGVIFKGENSFSPTYFIPTFDTTDGYTEYLMRNKSYLFDVKDAEVVALAQKPYFNRTAEHFCSHQHAPNNRAEEYPAAVIKGNVGYIGWDVFSGYAEHGELQRKELVNYMITRLMNGDFAVETNLPDRGIITVQQKPDEKIVHLLFAHTTVRGKNVEVIEDVVPLYDTKVTLACKEPESVTTMPEGKNLPFEYKSGKLTFTVPKFLIHTMVIVKEK